MSFFKLLFCIVGLLFLNNHIMLGQAQEIPLSQVKFRKGGDVVKLGENCYQLTDDMHWSSGAIWYPSPIDLNADFEMEVEIFLGCEDGGADGIVFIFSPSLKVGYAGEGMGFAGLFPSLGIEFDTYQNYHLGDPIEDHIAVLSNGRPNHRRDLAGPMSVENLEDCKNHQLKVVWSAKKKEILVFLDGKNIIGLQKNIIADIFNKNATVYWGFSAATGGKRNQHKICFEKLVFEEVPLPATFSRTKLNTMLNGDITPLDNVLFESGSAILKKESDKELARLLNFLKQNPAYHLSIYGHTDAIGDAKKNESLSQKRADVIAKYLIENGISPKRLSAKGMGERLPIASNETTLGRKQNRRIEVYLYIPIP